MNSKLGKILKYTLWLSIAAVLLYFSFRKIEWGQFAETLGQTSWGFVLASMLCGLAAFWVRGLRWKQLMSPLDKSIKVGTCWNAVNVANMCNLVIPYSGDLVKCGMVSGKARRQNAETEASYDKVLGTVVLERAWDLLSIAIIIATVLVFKWEDLGNYFTDEILGRISSRFTGTVAAVLIALGLAFAAFIAAIWFLRKKGGIFGKIYGAIAGVLRGFTVCFRMPGRLRFMLLTAAIWTLYWLQMVCIGNAIPAFAETGAGLSDALFLMTLGSIAGFVPVPGGYGAFHWLIATALTLPLFGLPWETGMLFAILSHESQSLLMIISGGVSWFASAKL